MTKIDATVTAHEGAFNAKWNDGDAKGAIEHLITAHCTIVLGTIFGAVGDESLESQHRMLETAGLSYVEIGDIARENASK